MSKSQAHLVPDVCQLLLLDAEVNTQAPGAPPLCLPGLMATSLQTASSGLELEHSS